MPKAVKKKRDPISKAPLRDPGQSLREELDREVDERLGAWLMAYLIGLLLCGLEWYRWYFQTPPTPVLYTVLTVLALPLVLWRLRSGLRVLKNIKRGLKGERYVGQFLQSELAPKGYRIFHDICDEGVNIDHALIGPGGVFAIETKTRCKGTAPPKVHYDGHKVRIDGYEPDRDPVAQARAAAARLAEIIREYSGHRVRVRAVVLFPKWYVVNSSRNPETWVLNGKAFVGFLAREAEQLSHEQQTAMAEGLSRYIREWDQRH